MLFVMFSFIVFAVHYIYYMKVQKQPNTREVMLANIKWTDNVSY